MRILKWLLVLLVLWFCSGNAFSQQLALGKNPYMMNKSAVLELNTDNQGLLLPRLTDTTGINALNPPDGMIIYFVPAKQLLIRTNGYWSPLASTFLLNNYWSINGNTNGAEKRIGNTDNFSLPFITNNTERMRIAATGHIGIGISDPANPLVVKDTMEIRRVGPVSTLLFSNTSGSGDFRIGADGGDIFWQGGGGRNLQMGAYWSIVLSGDRQTSNFPAFSASTSGTNVLIPAQRTSSVPLAIQSASGQTANLTEWRNAAGSVVTVINKNGDLGLGTSNPTDKLTVAGSVSPSSSGIYNLGSSSSRWNQLYATNGTINTSDRRMKKNIQNLTYGLKEVMNLQPVSYNWKDPAHTENKIGLIAQDVQKVVPEVVVGDEAKETLGMNYAELVPVLINAIKEQQKQIDELKKEKINEQNTQKELRGLKEDIKTLMEKVSQLESKRAD